MSSEEYSEGVERFPKGDESRYTVESFKKPKVEDIEFVTLDWMIKDAVMPGQAPHSEVDKIIAKACEICELPVTEKKPVLDAILTLLLICGASHANLEDSRFLPAKIPIGRDITTGKPLAMVDPLRLLQESFEGGETNITMRMFGRSYLTRLNKMLDGRKAQLMRAHPGVDFAKKLAEFEGKTKLEDADTPSAKAKLAVRKSRLAEAQLNV